MSKAVGGGPRQTGTLAQCAYPKPGGCTSGRGQYVAYCPSLRCPIQTWCPSCTASSSRDELPLALINGQMKLGTHLVSAATSMQRIILRCLGWTLQGMSVVGICK